MCDEAVDIVSEYGDFAFYVFAWRLSYVFYFSNSYSSDLQDSVA